ncbi:MAG: rhodanese-like domain-containing protein [Nitrospirota bacterium]
MKRFAALLILLTMILIAVTVSGVAFAQDTALSNATQRLANIYLLTMPDGSHHLTAQALRERMVSGKEDFVLIDVRPKDYYERGHIPGAEHIDAREITKPEVIAMLSKEKDIIVYGSTSREQNSVIIALARLGYKVCALKDGYYGYVSSKPAVADAMMKF